MENNQKEIDLFYVSDRIKGIINYWIVLAYSAITFLKKAWWLILIVLAAGVGYGYYLESKADPAKEARTLLRINFDAVNYVYSVVENLNSNFPEQNVVFSEDKDINRELSKIVALELVPVIDIKDILDRYDQDDRRLENILRNAEFSFDDEAEFAEISETFRSEYYYHQLSIVAASSADEKTVEALIKFINQAPILMELKEASVANMQERIADTEETIDQINMVLEKYKIEDASGLNSGSQLYVVDNFDISKVFSTKVDLLGQLDDMKRDFVYAKDVVINVNKPKLFNRYGFFKSKMVHYAVFFLFLFFLLAFARFVLLSMKRVADNHEG